MFATGYLLLGCLFATSSHALNTKLPGTKFVNVEHLRRSKHPTGRSKASRLERFKNHLKAPRHPDITFLLSQYHELDPIPVDYAGRHPFELAERRRKLQAYQDPVPVNQTEYGDRNEMAPIRTRFLTEILAAQLESTTDPAIAAKLSVILETVIPAAIEEWATHLSVFPVVGALPVTEESCLGVFGEEPLLQSYLGAGVEDADMALIAVAIECEATALASAGPCNRDQFDRPIIGIVRFCVNAPIDATDADDVADLFSITVHEMAHALGFLSDLLPYFRNARTGEPLTPRTAAGAVALQTVPCTNGTDQTIPFPAENTLRGVTTTPGVSGVERLHYEVVTPRVTTVARNLFNCQTLTGARFENRPTTPTDCAGSHWDERFFGVELMTPIANREGDGQGLVLSPMTLAFFEDSGFYAASYENVGLPSYGLGMGCEFVEGDCIVGDAVPEYGKGIFCDAPLFDELIFSCDPRSHTSWAVCDLADQRTFNASLLPEDPTLYFSDPLLVGLDPQMDFCPSPSIPANLFLQDVDFVLDCTDEKITFSNWEGETSGANSRCVNTAVEGFVGLGSRVVPACLPIECDEANSQVIVGGQVCEFDGQMHSISVREGLERPFTSGMFECPRLSLLCPDLFGCPGACSGRGACDYGVTPPQCNCFDPADSSSPLCAAAVGGTPPPTPSATSPPSGAAEMSMFVAAIVGAIAAFFVEC